MRAGAGGNILLTVGGDLILRGPTGSLPGAIISSSRLSNAAKPAGSITASVNGDVTLEAGSIVAASTPNGSAGTIGITADGRVTIAGLVASGPSRQVLGTKLTGRILDDGKGRADRWSDPHPVAQLRGGSGGGYGYRGLPGRGRRIADGPARGVRPRDPRPGRFAAEGGGLLAGRAPFRPGLLVDGRDLGVSGPTSGRSGRVRADGMEGWLRRLHGGPLRAGGHPGARPVLGFEPRRRQLLARDSDPALRWGDHRDLAGRDAVGHGQRLRGGQGDGRQSGRHHRPPGERQRDARRRDSPRRRRFQHVRFIPQGGASSRLAPSRAP